MSNVTVDVRAYPIDNQESNTKAFASASFQMNGDNIAAIHGVRVVDGENGLFVSMPQSKDKEGKYHDIAFPTNSELRKAMDKAILAEYKNPTLDADGQMFGRQTTVAVEAADPGKLKARAFPLRSGNSGSTLAFANVTVDNIVAINGVRVVDGENGLFVSMPQSKDKEGNYHDIAFPLSGDLRKEITKAVLADFDKAAGNERDAQKQSIGGRLADGREQLARDSANKPPQQSAAKRAPGLGD